MGLSFRALSAKRKFLAADIEVFINEQRIIQGSVVSMSGRMVVRSAAAYQLRMDGVVWEPIESTDEGDIYVLASGGRCTIFANDKLAFYFTNDYQNDFAFGQNSIEFFDTERHSLGRINSTGLYTQGNIPAGAVSARVITYPVNMDEVAGLDYSTNQDATISRLERETYVQADLSNIDDEKYLLVSLGNVLLSFTLPF